MFLNMGMMYSGSALATTPGSIYGVAVSTDIPSREFWPTDESGAITIVDGTYSLAGAAHTAEAGTFTAGESVVLINPSSESNSTQTDTVVTINGTEYTFSATTVAELPSIADRYTNTDHYTNTGHYL